MAHLTNFSFEFFYEIFTEDPSLLFLYHGAKKSKMTKHSIKGSCLRARSRCRKQNAKPCVFMTVAKQICILECGVSLSCKRGLKRTQTKTGVTGGGGGGGEKIHANVTAAKRELRNALFSSQKPKVFYCQLSQRLVVVVDIDCSVRKESLFESSWKSKIMKTWVCRLFTQLMPKIGNAHVQS